MMIDYGTNYFFQTRIIRNEHLFKCRISLGKEKNEWQERGYVLGQFRQGEREAVRGYRKFIKEGKDQGRRAELMGGGLLRS
ncbi:MAG: hypothetical protein ABSG91_11470 [Syntrophobacteraceae bacterium]